MKIDPHSLPPRQNRQTQPHSGVKLRVCRASRTQITGRKQFTTIWRRETKCLLLILIGSIISCGQIQAQVPTGNPAQNPAPLLTQNPVPRQNPAPLPAPIPQFTTPGSATDSIAVKTANVRSLQSEPQAVSQIDQVIDRLVNGGAFDAKVRQRVWTAGREMVGVGTYEQAGSGTGWFSLQITMLDGDGKHTLQQISDGRLAWTRSQINAGISLRRVDVGRLHEWVPQTKRVQRAPFYVPPRLKVGGWAEMLDSIKRDYVLSSAVGRVQSGRSDSPGGKLLVISGALSDAARDRIKTDSRLKKLPELFPTSVKIAIAIEPSPETNFGNGLPIRLEYWSDPIKEAASSEAANQTGRLVSLVEIYSIRPISPPPIERFRFENQDPSINFVNETDRYLKRYNIRLTDKQRKQLLR